MKKYLQIKLLQQNRARQSGSLIFSLFVGVKNINRLFVLVIMFIFVMSIHNSIGQATGDYRSAATGDWNVAASWERFNGTTWVTPATAPTSADGVITIRSPHSITITATLTYDQVIVNAGAQVTVNPTVTTTLANGSGTDLTINGTWLNTGGTWTMGNANSSWVVNAGGTFIHNTTSGISAALDEATLNAASTFIYRGSSTLTPPVSTSGRIYGNLVFESTSGGYTASASGVGTLTINGDFSIGTGVNYSTTQTGVMTFAGNFTNNGTLTNSSGAQVYTFTGNGKTISGTSSTSFENLNINSGALLTITSPVTLVFSFTGNVAGTVELEAVLTNTGTLNVSGTFQLNQGGSMIGNNCIYSSTGTLIYNGTSTQTATARDFPPTNSPANVIMNNSSGVTLPAAFTRTITGNLALNTGNFADGGNTLTVGGNITGNASHSGLGKILMNGSGKTISGATLKNLELNNAGNFSLTGSPTITGTLTMTSGKLSLGNNNLNVSTIVSSASSYIVTNGTGNLIMTVPAAPTMTTLPIGATTTSYDPVVLSPTNSASFSANVKVTTGAGDFAGTIVSYANVAPRQWNITPTGTPGSTEISLTNGTGGYTPASPVIGHYTAGNVWEELPANFLSNKWTATTLTFSPFGAGNAGAFVCSPSSVNSSPADVAICVTDGSAMFSGSFNSGYPTPELKWQVQTGGVGAFSDLSEVSPYSGTNTGTLTLTLPNASLSGNRYRLKASNTCGDVFTASALLTIYNQPVSNAGADDSACSLTYQLNANPTFGTGAWTYDGPGTAAFSPNANNASAIVSVTAYGAYTFTWTETNGTCTDNDDVTITFYEQPNANAGTDTDQCDLNGSLNATPSTGTGTWTYSGPGTAIFSDENDPDASVSVSTYGQYIFTWTETNGPCSDNDAVTINFFEQPTANAGTDASECDLITILNATPSVGVGEWTYDGPGTAIFSPDENNPDATATVSAYGTYTFTWTETTGTCNDNDDVIITLYEQPIANAGPDAEECDLTTILTASPSVGNGAWSSNGPGSASFAPNANSPTATVIVNAYGTYTFTWTETNGTCSDNDETLVEFFEIPTLDCPDNMEVCIEDDPFTLTGATPLNGTYSGNGVSMDVFNPSIADIGSHTITYSYTDGNGCTNTCTFVINVTPLPIVTCPDYLIVCEDEAPFPLTGATPSGGTYSGAGISSNLFDPSEAGVGIHLVTYNYTATNGCSNSCTFNISVYPVAQCNITSQMNWVLLPTGLNGTCTSTTNCCTDILCYGLEYTPELTGNLTGYTSGFFANCVLDETPIISNSSCVMIDNSEEINGCDDYDLVLFNCSGNSGSLPVTAGIPTIIHQVCFEVPVGETVTIQEDDVTDIATTIDLNGGGYAAEYPVYSDYLIERLPPVVPSDVIISIECVEDAIELEAPEVVDMCGNMITPTGPEIGGTYVDCEGTYAYTYTYTDCAGQSSQWSLVYIIQHSTSPAQAGGPVPTSADIAGTINAVPPALPEVIDVCGNELTGILVSIVKTPDPLVCTGTVVYNYTFTDCAGLIYDWAFTYNVDNTIETSCPGPMIVCEADPSFSLGSAIPSGGAYSGAGVTGDQMSGFTFDPASAGPGLHVITYSVTGFDDCISSCSFNITVNAISGCDVTPSMSWVPIASGTNGTCLSETECCEDIYCYGLQYIPSYTGDLSSYTTGFFADCVLDDTPIVSNISCVMNDNSDEINGCDEYDLVLFNCSGNSGSFPVTAGIPVILHQVCFYVPPGNSITIAEDEVTDLATAIELIGGGFEAEFPTYSEFEITKTFPTLINEEVDCSFYNATAINECLSEAMLFDPESLEASLAALYTVECGSSTAQYVSTDIGMSNSDCEWTFTYHYSISDGCPGHSIMCSVTRSGSDQNSPVLVDEDDCSTFDLADINSCLSDALLFDATTLEGSLAALYFDDCGSVTATFEESVQNENNTDCEWSITYEFTISDGCSANDISCFVTRSGSDQTAPTLTGIPYAGSSGTNACMETAATAAPFSPTNAIQGYTDNCGEAVTAQLTDTDVTGDNCGWTVTYTFTILDECLNPLANQSYSNTGSDQTAPALTGTPYAGTAGTNACMEDAASAAPFSATNAIQGYTDNCGEAVTAQLTNTQVTGEDCGWTVTYTFTVFDACLNPLANQSYSNTGSDQTAPALTGAPYTGTSGTNACMEDAASAAPFSAANAIQGYTDNCGEAVTAQLTNTQVTGEDCDWTVTYTFTVLDACLNPLANQTYSNTGSDQTAPTLTGTPYAGTSGTNACMAMAETAAPFSETNAIQGYTDNCGEAVTAQLTNTQVTGNDCGWTVTYTFTILDACLNPLANQAYSNTGSDQTAPTLTGTPYAGTSGTNACMEDAASAAPFSATNAIQGYTDNCGEAVTAQLTNTEVTGEDCGWTVTYTFTILDECLNPLANQTYSNTGSDQTAPTLAGTPYAGTIGTNACMAMAETASPFSAANAIQGYTDNCGEAVTAQLTNTQVTGDDCAWTVTYTFTILDACLNPLANQSYSNTGSDQTAPILTGTQYAGTSGTNACMEDAATAAPFSATNAIQGYTDSCGEAVTAELTNTQVTGEDCGWTVTYTFTVFDACLNPLANQSYSNTGSDQTAPALTGAPYTGTSGTNACMEDAASAAPFSAANAIQGYTDICGGSVTAQLTNTQVTGDNCSWTVTYTFNILDECLNPLENQSYSNTGSDQTAPTLIGTPYAGTSGTNACMEDAATAAPFSATNAIQGYTDNCGEAVTAQLTNTQITGEDCGWTVTYTFTVFDACLNPLANQSYSNTGSDQTAPTLTGTPYAGTSGTNACKAMAETAAPFSAANAIQGYTDNCGEAVTAQLTNTQVTGDDCAWTVTYTFTIHDACLNPLANQTYSNTGSDQTAPTLTGTPYAGTNGTNACMEDAETAAPFSATNAILGYTDNCGEAVTAQLTNTQVTGEDCAWTVTYTYSVLDACLNPLANQTYSNTGSDQTAPALTGTPYAGTTGTNACIEDAVSAAPFNATNAIQGFTDNCGGPVTAVLTDTGISGTDCDWTVLYTFTVFDECMNPLANQIYSNTGSDQTAPTLTGTPYAGTSGTNACMAMAATAAPFSATNAIQGYTDNCGEAVTAQLTNTQMTGDDCAWTVTYTFTVFDACLNPLANQTYSNTGSDQTAPALTGTPYSGTTGTNACIEDAVSAAPFSATNAIQGFTDNCGGPVTAVLTDTGISGTDCGWTVLYTFTVFDECMNPLANQTYSNTGSDQTAPTLTGTPFAGTLGTNACMQDAASAAPFSATNAIQGYTDNCGEAVTAQLTNIQVTGDDCAWTVTYTFTILDACLNPLANQSYSNTGSDQAAPTLTGIPYAGTSGTNACMEDAASAAPFSATNAIQGYTDNCGGPVTAVLTDTGISGTDCGWTVLYTFTVFDECLNPLANQTYSNTGSDQTAPTLTGTPYAGTTGTSACIEDAATAAPFSSTNAIQGYTDNCGEAVTAQLTNTQVTGEDCSWTVTYTFTILDACLNPLANQSYSNTGSDQTAPALTGIAYAGTTGTNACMQDAATAAPFSATNAIQGYTDNCGEAVTAQLTNTQVTGDDCAWTVTYTFTVLDACLNPLADQSYSNTGSDQTAPTLTGIPYAGTSGTYACMEDAASAAPFSATNAIQGYTDNCGGPVTAVLTDTGISGTDCGWTVLYTFTVFDECMNPLANQTYSNTGSDQTAPTLTGTPYAGTSGTNACMAMAETAAPFSATNAIQGYTDNCGEAVTAQLTNTQVTGDDCAWTVTYTFTVLDACLNPLADQSYSNTGSDQTAPTLTGIPYAGTSGTNACMANAVTVAPFDAINAIQGYTDNCGEAVTAQLTNTQVTGEDCAWTVTYTFTILDACLNPLANQTYSNTGSDQTAPALTGAPYTGTSGTNACMEDAASAAPFSAANAIQGYTDNCGGSVTAQLTNTQVTGDNCSWSVTYTFTILDECLNPLENQSYSNTGSDQTAPTLIGTPYAGTTGTNACVEDAATAAPFSATNAIQGYTDNCGEAVTAQLTNTQVTGDDCGWTVTYTFTILDACLNPLANQTYSNTGSDQTAPALTGTPYAGTTGTNACIEDAVSAAPFNAIHAIQGYSDNCDGPVTAVLTDTGISGTDCGWTILYTFTVFDECMNPLANQTYSNTGSDQTAPTLTGTPYAGTSGTNACMAMAETAAPFSATNAIQGYTDNCGEAVTAELTNTEVTGEDCAWTVTYTFTVLDACLNPLANQTYSNTGSDQTAPALTGTPYPGTTGTNACMANAVTAAPFDAINAIQGYTDNCGGPVTAVLTDTGISGTDCGWTILYTFTVFDECMNPLANQTYSNTGNDQTAPTLSGTPYTGTSGTNACMQDAATAASFSATNAIQGYTDNCGGAVTAQLTNTQVTGDNCSWSVTYTFTILDECLNPLENQSYSNTGSDQTAPALTGIAYAGTTGTNACMQDATTAAPFSATNAIQGYTDNCGEAVTAQLTSTQVTGEDCGWTVTYTFTVLDACLNPLANQTYSNTGSDQTAPALTGTPYAGTTDTNACIEDAVSAAPFNAIHAIQGYTDNCGGPVTAVLTDTGISGTDCDWTVLYTFTVFDECMNPLANQTYSNTGSDQTAPILTGTPYAGTSGTNACMAMAETAAPFNATNAIQGYTDNCGEAVTAQLTNTQMTGDDCAWTVTYTFTVFDACLNPLTDQSYSNTGSDQTAPALTGTPYPGTTGTNACMANAVTAAPFSATNAIQSYTDNCGGPVTAVLTDTGISGTDCGWTILYTFTVFDECMNPLANQTYSNTGSDQTAPTLTGTPFAGTSGTNACMEDAASAAPFSATNAIQGYTDNCDGAVTAQLTNTQVTGEDCGWTVTYTFTILDACLNPLANQSYSNTGSDQTAPALTGTPYAGTTGTNACMEDAASAAPFSATDAIQGYTDNCGGAVTALLTDTGISGSDCGWTVLYTFTVFDECMNPLANQTYSNTGSDQTAPALTGTPYAGTSGTNACIDEAASAAPFSASNAIAGYTDNCGEPVTAQLTNTQVTGDDCGWTVTYTFTVLDACLNPLPNQTYSNTGSDQTAPTLTGIPYAGTSGTNACMDDAASAAPFSASNAIQGYTDNCGEAVTAQLTNTQVTGADCNWTVTYTFTVLDACLNPLANQTYSNSGSDQTAPALTGTPFAGTTGTNACMADAVSAAPFNATNAIQGYTDNCGGPVTAVLTDTGISGTDCGWTILYTFTVFDECMNPLANQTYSNTGSDQTNPVASNPLPMNVQCIDDIPAPDITVVTDEMDNCGSTPTVTFVGDSNNGGTGCAADPYIVTRTYSVEDACENSITVTQTITVIDDADPVVVCQDITVILDENGNASIIPSSLNDGSTDNCSSLSFSVDIPTVDCDDVTQFIPEEAGDLLISQYIEGTNNSNAIEIFNGTGSAVDLGSNQYQLRLYANGSATATATLNLPAVMLPDGETFVIAHDLASPTILAIADLTNSTVMSFNGDDALALTKNGAAGTFVDIFGSIGTDPGTEWTGGGNSTLNRTLLRKNTVLQGITTNPSPTFPELATEWDGLPVNDESGLGEHAFIALPSNPVIVTLTATDECGNSNSCTASVIVEDNIPPVALTQDVTVQLNSSGLGTLSPASVDNGSYDACGIGDLELNISQFSCADIGPNIVTLTVTDVNGNTSTNTAIAFVEDNVPPIAVCQDITVQLDPSGSVSITADDVNNGSSDGCGIANIEIDIFNFDCDNIGSNIITLTVTDETGNTNTCTSFVTVQPMLVTNTNDSGPGSARYVIACLPAGGIVDFSPSLMSQTIVLTSGPIVIDKDITINGLGKTDLAISGNNTSGIFNLLPGNEMIINNLTMRDANSLTNGGAIFAAGDLTLEDVLLENNFENSIPKSMTLTNTATLTIIGQVEFND